MWRRRYLAGRDDPPRDLAVKDLVQRWHAVGIVRHPRAAHVRHAESAELKTFVTDPIPKAS